MNNFYTYAYLDQNHKPYYIGKGSGNRAWKQHDNVKKPAIEQILLLKTCLTEEEAFAHEKYMIAVLGRLDNKTGILQNRTAGGQGNSGYMWSAPGKEAIRQRITGKKWWNNGTQNKHSKSNPGEGWNEGRIITWNEELRLTRMTESASRFIYQLTHKSGLVAYVRNLHKLGGKCGHRVAFYRVLSGEAYSYKGWIKVEKVEIEVSCFDDHVVINMCKQHDSRVYKITHKDGSIMFVENLFEAGREHGTKDGFWRVFQKKRQSYKGWIAVELIEQE
jgi:hypothetical protein